MENSDHQQASSMPVAIALRTPEMTFLESRNAFLRTTRFLWEIAEDGIIEDLGSGIFYTQLIKELEGKITPDLTFQEATSLIDNHLRQRGAKNDFIERFYKAICGIHKSKKRILATLRTAMRSLF